MIQHHDLWAGIRTGFWLVGALFTTLLVVTVVVSTPWWVYGVGISVVIIAWSVVQTVWAAMFADDRPGEAGERPC